MEYAATVGGLKMQPLGRKPIRLNLEDCHPPKGYVNWWEKEIGSTGNKKAARQDAKKEITKELRNQRNR